MAKSSAVRKTKPTPTLALVPAEPIKLDLGCGTRKQPGYQGVDVIAFVGVEHVLDIRVTPWKWADNSVSDIHCSHFLEHLTAWERVAFLNECYRVLVPAGKMQIVVPHWCSCRAYGDPTHQWPPVSEFSPLYWNREWREREAPHTDYHNRPDGFRCDFALTSGYGMRQDLLTRAREYQQHALENFKEAAQDYHVGLTSLKPA
jgi:Methyltransferase domain